MIKNQGNRTKAKQQLQPNPNQSRDALSCFQRKTRVNSEYNQTIIDAVPASLRVTGGELKTSAQASNALMETQGIVLRIF